MKYCLILTYDDLLIQKATQLLLQSINKYDPSFFARWQTQLICPSCFSANHIRQLERYYPVEVKLVKFTAPINKYELKRAVYDYISNDISNGDDVLYLDYDHVFRDKFNVPTLIDNEIYLSSEVHRLKLKQVTDASIVSSLHGQHYNNSLIYATKSNLDAVLLLYQSMHDRYCSSLPSRYSEEIVFSLACINAQLTLRTMRTNQQGHLQSNGKSAVYHYGGESEKSRVAKLMVKEESTLIELNEHLFGISS